MGIHWAYFGLQINDVFGVVVILETLFTTLNLFGSTSLQIDLLQHNAKDDVSNDKEVLLGTWLCVITTIKLIAFVSLIWIGFICMRKGALLRGWIILSILLDVTLQIVWFIFIYNDDHPIIPIWEHLAFLCTIIIFRSYIYTMVWMAWMELSQGGDFRGYGQGLCYLFHYYKSEFRRMAAILLLVEMLWTFRMTVEFELPMEFGVQLVGLEGYSPLLIHRGYTLYLVRFVVSVPAFYYVMNDRKTVIKFCAIPFFLLAIGLQIGNFVYSLVSINPSDDGWTPYGSGVLFILSLFFRGILIYYLLRFVLSKSNPMVPLQSQPTHADMDDDDDETMHVY